MVTIELFNDERPWTVVSEDTRHRTVDVRIGEHTDTWSLRTLKRREQDWDVLMAWAKSLTRRRD